MTTEIIVTVREHGTHYWPDAPDKVAYLRHPHRHEFIFRVAVAVEHDDRDTEFHMLQGMVKESLEERYEWESSGLVFGPRSCETIARDLGVDLAHIKALRVTSVEVWEDGENGGRVTWGPGEVPV